MAKIHPTAIVDPSAQLADDVEIGAYSVIEGKVSIGQGTVIRPHAVVRKYTTMGGGNMVDSFVCLGGDPQDLKFDQNTESFLKIGDHNTFREGVTISRATGTGNSTVVGSKTYWMATSHAGHNATVEDEAILVNGAMVAGHATIGKGAIISGSSLVHQFCWVGMKVMTQGGSATSQHVPPFCILARNNEIAGLNVVGMRRTPGFTEVDRRQVKEAFRLLYRDGMSSKQALVKMDEHADWGVAATIFRDFIRKVVSAEKPFNRGICKLGMNISSDE